MENVTLCGFGRTNEFDNVAILRRKHSYSMILQPKSILAGRQRMYSFFVSRWCVILLACGAVVMMKVHLPFSSIYPGKI